MSDPSTRAERALEVLTTLTGSEQTARLMSEGRESRGALADVGIYNGFGLTQGFMGELVMDWAFGDVWSRPQLSRRDRSFVVISALAALNLEHEVEIHLQGALNHGVTRVEIEEIMITLTLYGGFARAIDGLRLARKVFARAP